MDEAKLHDFVGKMLNDLGATTSATLIRIGDRLGIYKAMHQAGPLTSAQLAEKCGLSERYVREWLCAQASAGYLAHHAPSNGEADRFELTPEQAMVFVVEESPVYLLGGFDVARSLVETEDDVAGAFRSGGGIEWGELGQCMFCAVGRFFRPGYVNSLLQAWLPALDGVVEKLERGARVADIGCGVGFSTTLMAKAFPNSTFIGYDFHEPSILDARSHTENHGLEGRLRFEVALAKDIDEEPFDLVTCFDCLHDMGDPAGAAGHVRELLKPDGTWMIVEPIAGDSVKDNLHPVGRLFYNASATICLPTSLAQEVGAALGGQAGERALSDVIRRGGFSTVRRATEGPFNMILEAKP